MSSRLAHVDALRGLAALYVVLHHTVPAVAAPGSLAAWWQQAFLYGPAGVDLFLVVSGFVLFLPIAEGRRAAEPYGRFMLRRAWRIVPPYYAALAGSLAMLWWLPAVTNKLRYAADTSPANVLAHLLMINNLGPPNWQYGINYPLWTIPLEFQLYAAFPLFALALARLGPLAALAGAASLTMAARYMAGHGLVPMAVAMTVPGFMGVFVAGMAAAVVYARHPRLAALPRRVLGVGAIVLLATAVVAWQDYRSFLVVDATFGLAFMALLLWLGGRERQVPRPLVTLGRMSYSLYLTHAILLGLWRLVVLPMGLPIDTYLLLTGLLAVPGIVAVAYAFHLAVERPFLGRPPFLAPAQLDPAR